MARLSVRGLLERRRNRCIAWLARFTRYLSIPLNNSVITNAVVGHLET
jgi:hypothetical protein